MTARSLCRRVPPWRSHWCRRCLRQRADFRPPLRDRDARAVCRRRRGPVRSIDEPGGAVRMMRSVRVEDSCAKVCAARCGADHRRCRSTEPPPAGEVNRAHRQGFGNANRVPQVFCCWRLRAVLDCGLASSSADFARTCTLLCRRCRSSRRQQPLPEYAFLQAERRLVFSTASPLTALPARLDAAPVFDPVLAARGSNSKPVVPSGFLIKNAENFRRVRFETNPRIRSVRPSFNSFAICVASIGCCKITLPERKSQRFSDPDAVLAQVRHRLLEHAAGAFRAWADHRRI